MADLEKDPEISVVVTSAPQTPVSQPAGEKPALSSFAYRKLIWKLDLHLLPGLFALWFVSLIDRVNIGNAVLRKSTKAIRNDVL